MANESTLESVDNETVTNATLDQIGNIDREHFLQGSNETIIYLILLMIIGLVGNTHTFVLFTRRKTSNFREIVITLSSVDLVVVSVCVPLNMVEMTYIVTYPSDILCKITRFTSFSFNIASLSLLFVVAFERHRKICYPLQWQFSIRALRMMNAAFLVAVLLLCTPHLVISGLVEETVRVKTDQQFIHICGMIKNYLEHVLHFSLLLFLVSLAFAIAVFYGLICREIFQPKHSQNNKDNPSLTVRKNTLKGARFRAIIFLVVTIVSYVGLLPTGIFAIMAGFRDRDTETDQASVAYFHLITRLPFLNNIVNPIIYFSMDSALRKEIKELYIGLFLKCHNRFKL